MPVRRLVGGATGAALLLAAFSACQGSPRPRTPPPAYPTHAPPPPGYPPAQYPPPQYPGAPPPSPPPQGTYPYPPATSYPAPPAPPAPPPVSAPAPGPAAPPPSVPHDPINQLNLGWLRQRAQSILAELVAALPGAARERVQGIPLAVDDTVGEVNAFAACADGRSFMAITDGLLEISAWLAMAAAHDEVFGSAKTDEYISFLAHHLQPDKPIPRPAGFFSPAALADGRKVQRQHALFEEEVAFILGHELAHHHLGHLPCTGQPGWFGSADLARVLASRVPVLNQPNEGFADLAGTTNLLDAGVRRAGPRWSEGGALLTMRFFQGLEGSGLNLLLAFQRSHPAPALRVQWIRDSANYWRRSGGVGIPVPRLGS